MAVPPFPCRTHDRAGRGASDLPQPGENHYSPRPSPSRMVKCQAEDLEVHMASRARSVHRRVLGPTRRALTMLLRVMHSQLALWQKSG
jgi:hypothetical protein